MVEGDPFESQVSFPGASETPPRQQALCGGAQPYYAPTRVDCSDIAHIRLVDSRAASEGAGRVLFTLEDAQRKALGASHRHCVSLQDALTCSTVEHALGGRAVERGLSSLLVAPGASGRSRDRALELAKVWIDALPYGERVAVYRWGHQVTQLTTFTADRELLLRQLHCGLSVEARPRAPHDEALAMVRAELLSVSRFAFTGWRALAVISPDSDPLREDPPIRSGAVWTREITSMDALQRASSALRQARGGGMHVAGYCGSESRSSLVLRVAASGVERRIEARFELPPGGERSGACSPADMMDESRDHTQFVDLRFTSEQRKVYDERVLDEDKNDFRLALRFSDRGPLIAARAHLRGKSSMHCERKSYSVNIDGPAPHYLMPGSATDEFLLIAMCKDPYYIHQFTANQLLERLGIFPLHSRMVELRLDGEGRGVYLLMEKPSEALRHNSGRVRSVIRRGTDILGSRPDVKYSIGSEEGAVAAYGGMLRIARSESGQELVDQLAARMDLRQYLRWIALMTLLRSHDHIDEAWFVSTETTTRSGRPTDFYSMVSWDTDQLFGSCHRDGQYAIDDPHGLLHCTESLFDHAAFSDPVFYALYVQVLEEVLGVVSTERVRDALQESTDAVLHYLKQDDIRSASSELIARKPGAIEFSVARRVVLRAAKRLMRRYERQAGVLRSRIAAYRGTGPARSD